MDVFSYISFWQLLVTVVVAGAYAFILYQKKESWSKLQNYFLSGIRFFAVAGLLLLFFLPQYKSNSNIEILPSYVVLQDNSKSVDMVLDSTEKQKIKTKIKHLEIELGGKIYQESVVEKIDGYKAKISPIHQALSRVKEKYNGSNLAGVFFLSDGIDNVGLDYSQQYYNMPIHVIALGESVEQKDIFIKKVNYNKSIFKGNDFLIKAYIGAKGINNRLVTLVLKQDGEVIDKQNVLLVNETAVYTKMLNAKSVGVHRYELFVKKIDEEQNPHNNQRYFAVNVVEDSKRVLIYAAYPHPTIGMLDEILSSNDKYNVKIKYEYEKLSSEDTEADVYVFCDIIPKGVLKQKVEKKGSIYFIIDPKKNINLGWFNFKKYSVDADEVLPVLNTSFSDFVIEHNNFDLFRSVQPLSVPFGEIILNSGESVLNQRVGELKTQKPLVAIKANQLPHQAVVLGDGWWRLKMYENSKEEKVVEDFFYKLINFCASEEDKQGLVVFLDKQIYSTIEVPVLNISFTTKSGERLGNMPVRVTVKKEGELGSKVFSYVLSDIKSVYKLKQFSQGKYYYTTQINHKGVKHIKKGSFSVIENNIEVMDLVMNQSGLQKLAKNNKGDFLNLVDFLSLDVKKYKGTTLLKELVTYKDIIHYKWIFVLLIVLLICEWAVRKILGRY